MSQIVNGILLGQNVYIFRNTGDPNALTSDPNMFSCAVGSLYLRLDAPDTTHALYVCTTAGTPATPQGLPAVAAVWTAK